MRERAVRGSLAIGGLVLATAIGMTIEPPTAYAEPECLTASNDFNRDHEADVAVGMPGANEDAGQVHVRVSADGPPERHALQIPQDDQPGDEFGAAVAEVAYYENEFDDHRCSQLVVGAPGRDVDGKKDAGAIYLYEYDTSEGEFSFVKEFVQGRDGVPGTAQAGARFGASLASPYHASGIAPVVTTLYVGAPGTDVDGSTNAGAFAWMKFGGDDPAATEGGLVTQGSGAPGTPETADRFGASLAAVEDGALVGAPGENHSAGGFVHWNADPDAENAFITQNSDGVPGKGERGDEYGATLYSAEEAPNADGGHIMLVGTPREDIGNVKDAGSAHVYRFDGQVHLDDVKGFNQGTTGVPGAPEQGDRFGSAFGTWGEADFLVGVPGEDLGDVADAGVVSALRGDRSWHQNQEDIPGAAAADDQFGAAIGNARTPFEGEETFWLDSPTIGVPGKNEGAGLVISGLPGEGSSSVRWNQENPQPGDGFGSSLGRTN